MGIEDLNVTQRFSDRVADYELYRPSYPTELLNFLDGEIGLKDARIADIGAGTGIFSRLLLDRGSVVDAVEPNAPMREAAIRALGASPRIRFHDGAAESTGLASGSVKLITCAQAFHWFDPRKARAEFSRILVPGGLVALIWNNPKIDTEVGRAYELVKTGFCGSDFQAVAAATRRLDAVIPAFFKSHAAKLFGNHQELDRDGLTGRFFSSSYAPKAGTSAHEDAKRALFALFDRFQSGGTIRLEYATELFLGP